MLIVVMLSDIMLNVVMLRIVMLCRVLFIGILNHIMLSIIMLIVMASLKQLGDKKNKKSRGRENAFFVFLPPNFICHRCQLEFPSIESNFCSENCFWISAKITFLYKKNIHRS